MSDNHSTPGGSFDLFADIIFGGMGLSELVLLLARTTQAPEPMLDPLAGTMNTEIDDEVT